MDDEMKRTAEHKRLRENYSKKKDWLLWGPYLSERQWGTVREDYSADGNAWDYFTHDMARSRAYRWGEDGLAGISDRYCNICFSLALWNGKDPILKERLFGVSGHEGNHGEDVKELYYYLENTPSHSYMKHLYKYPIEEYPYDLLLKENRRKGKDQLEYELLDTGVMNNDNYFDVVTEYAKADEEDLLIKITVNNRSDKDAELTLLPTLLMRNHWSFKEISTKPEIKKIKGVDGVSVDHPYVGKYNLYYQSPSRVLFTENETNNERLNNSPNDHPYKKDLFHQAVIQKDYSLTDTKKSGTKCAVQYELKVEGQSSKVIYLRLTSTDLDNPFNSTFDEVFKKRIQESEQFYQSIIKNKTGDYFTIQKQAFAGLLWSKQYYNYEVEDWLVGDPKQPTPPQSRLFGRNSNWKTLRNHDVISMPDKWEYPWYASWDLAFHCASYALIDAEFAKNQLLILTKEWYMAPNGQIPAYEWAFSDINPPVQAWAAIQVYKIDKKNTGKGDIEFLKRIFNKLSLNFTWWVNREDSRSNNVFEGGFLGLDNIGVFDRTNGIPGGAILEQVDGTSWMALFCLNMLEISLEIAKVDETFEDMSTKYFGHFVFIAEALNVRNEDNYGIWDDKDGFFYDKLIFPDGSYAAIKVRSIAGLMALAAVLRVSKETLIALPKFAKSVRWFWKYRMDKLKYSVIQHFAEGEDLFLSLVPKDRIEILLGTLLNEKEFLSKHGIRSISKIHKEPYVVDIKNVRYELNYEPAESKTGLFGGNSNWRGPIWFPINFLFIKALKEHSSYAGTKLKLSFPTGNAEKYDLNEITDMLCKRLINIFERDENGERPVNALHSDVYKSNHFKDHILFYEYFDGDNGRGVGASHQTGWTALVVNLIDEITY